MYRLSGISGKYCLLTPSDTYVTVPNTTGLYRSYHYRQSRNRTKLAGFVGARHFTRGNE